MQGLPTRISTWLPIPVIVAPVWPCSGVELVSAACRAGSSVGFQSPTRIRSGNSMTDGDLLALIEDGGIIALLQPRFLGTCSRWSADDGPAAANAADAARRPVSHTELMALPSVLLPAVLG